MVKKFIFLMLMIIVLLGCGGGGSNNEDNNNKTDINTPYILISEKNTVIANNKDSIKFKIYDKNSDTYIEKFELYVNGGLYDSNYFVTEKDGYFEVYGVYNNEKTNKITVTGYYLNNPSWELNETININTVNGEINYKNIKLELSTMDGNVDIYSGDSEWEYKNTEIISPVLFTYKDSAKLENTKVKIKLDKEYDNVTVFLGTYGNLYSYNQTSLSYVPILDATIIGNEITFTINIGNVEKKIKRDNTGNDNKIVIAVAAEENIVETPRFTYVGPYGKAITDKMTTTLNNAFRVFIEKLDISENLVNEAWTTPLTIKIMETKDTATYVGSPYGRKYDVIEVGYDAFRNGMLDIALTHEFFHFIQSCYEGSMANIVSSDYKWIDEATAITIEGLMKNDLGYVADLAENNKYFFVQGLSCGDKEVDAYNGDLGVHGYGASFFIRYLVKKAGDYKIIGRIYNAINNQSITEISSINALKTAISETLDKGIEVIYKEFIDEIFSDKMGSDFIRTIDNIDNFTTNKNYKFLIKKDGTRRFEDKRAFPELSNFVYKIKVASKDVLEIDKNSILRVKYEVLEDKNDTFNIKIIGGNKKIITDKKINNKLEIENFEKHLGEELFLIVSNLNTTDKNSEITNINLNISIPPIVKSISKDSIYSGEKVKINGYNYGNIQNNGKILLGNNEITKVVSWSNNEIELEIPDTIDSGEYRVKVSAYNMESEEEIYLNIISDKVEFDDAGFEELVRYTIGKPTGIITPDDMKKIQFLDDEHYDIQSIKGVEYCENLVKLNIRQGYSNKTNIENISYIKKLKKLKILGLTGNINNLSDLNELTNIERLILDGTTASDISVVKNMKNLVEFALYDGMIAVGGRTLDSLDPLRELTKLEDLYISNYNIKDISPLINLVNIKYLAFRENNIENIDALVNMKNLETLTLYKNKVKDIESLRDKPKLRHLDFMYNEVTDSSVIETLTALRYLDASNNHIVKFPNLSMCKELTNFKFEYNMITDITEISKLNSIQYLNIYFNQLTTLDITEKMDTVTSLAVFNNQLVNLNSVSKLENLVSINASNNKIVDISDIKNLKKLKTINLENNNLSDISILEDIMTLENVRLKGNEYLYTEEKLYSENGKHTDQNGKYDYIDTKNGRVIKILEERGCKVEYNYKLKKD